MSEIVATLVLAVILSCVGVLRWNRVNTALAAKSLPSPSGEMAAMKIEQFTIDDAREAIILFPTRRNGAWLGKMMSGFGRINSIDWIAAPERLVVTSTHAYFASDTGQGESIFDVQGQLISHSRQLDP